jgi:HD superfamily phosphohydrolase
MVYKAQRIRDPLHNVIGFAANEFENAIWEVAQTRQFQRLRRIKQLGFSDFVYPGATHSRFAHSIGVFHTARMLMQIIERHLQRADDWKESKADRALAAALVHDVGHGPFSHSFEEVGRRLKLKFADHELVSDALIRDSEIAEALNTMGTGFANDVADIVRGEGAVTLYSAVVSSQFDADRLDYMRRDRLMAGTHHGAIDFDWLVKNIEIGEVEFGVDEESLGKTNTFVLNSKAIYAAESYVLGLFQLYPTVYLHKTTRGAEKVFTELMCRTIEQIQKNGVGAVGLPKRHPICRFARNANDVERVVDLDDTVINGSLSLLGHSKDECIRELAGRLQHRKLYKCFDVRV